MTLRDQAALEYLTEFLKRNPQILEMAYGGIDSDEELAELQRAAEQPASWEMLGPRKPMSDDEFRRGQIGVYDDGVTPNQ